MEYFANIKRVDSSSRDGKFIGDCDKLVIWKKPKTCPKGLTKEEFATLPPTITVR
jgi:hypothetical protein